MPRSVMQISSGHIAHMGEGDLNALLADLLSAQAHRCGSQKSEIIINTEEKAKDDGCDGWSARPSRPDDWLGTTDSCWQFKAGTAGQPSKLKGEVLKPLPKSTLEKGGRFVVVASGSTNGKTGESARLSTLVEEAKAAGIPYDNIIVLGSERLAVWCNQHPAIAARWAKRPEGLCTFGEWAESDVHQVPWQAAKETASEFENLRADMDFKDGTVLHMHVRGHPGIGKTRYVLELCREAEWVGSVVYFPQATDSRLSELIDSVVTDADSHLTVVADEVQSNQLDPLRNSVGRGDGRIRLITIGQCPSPDCTRIPTREMHPLAPALASKVVSGWYPDMPREHVDFVVRFADGYIRLARLAADTVARNPSMNVRSLLGKEDIRNFMDQMLGSEGREALYVVAVLTRIGWEDDKRPEGEAVAKHLGLDWDRVRAEVERFHRSFGIAPRGGRFRYISPKPLGAYLAVEAWETYPDLMKQLPAVLPSDEARAAYYDQINSIASTPQVREYAREELAFFFRLSDFSESHAARRWAALSAADPELATNNIYHAMKEASIEARSKFKEARSEIVWALVKLSWRPTCFTEAMMSLALLAEAENETWSNNATGEFLSRFQVILGGTAVPYLDRLVVLDTLAQEKRPALLRLVIKALTRANETQHFSRIDLGPISDELPKEEWNPTNDEHIDCVRAAISRLITLASDKDLQIKDDIIVAATGLAILLRCSGVRSSVLEFLDVVRDVYPESREQIRKEIADIIYKERNYFKELPDCELEEIALIHSRFEDSSLASQLRQHVGPHQWERDEQPDLTVLAKDLLADQDVLRKEWSWLTSGEAGEAWLLGETLAKEDSTRELSTLMPSLSGAGPDQRVICGYINVCRQELGDVWYDEWFNTLLQNVPTPAPLLFEVAWRCGATIQITNRLVEVLNSEEIAPGIVGQLAYGQWDLLPPETLEEILQVMMSAGHEATVAAILVKRLKIASEKKDRWQSLALKIAVSSKLIRNRHTANYHWKKITLGLVQYHAEEIASAIFREQGERSTEVWFADYSEAKKVLLACVRANPKAVWKAMQPWIASRRKAFLFSVGFPRDVLDQISVKDVLEWVSQNPSERAPVLARLSSKDFSSDETLASRILGIYGGEKTVSGDFFSDYLSGTWSGPASAHWEKKALEMESVAGRTKLPKLQQWAQRVARDLFDMAKRERQLEEEEDTRYR